MAANKYYEKIDAWDADLTLEDDLPPFDLEAIRSKGVVAGAVAWFLDNPLPVLSLLRRFRPVQNIGVATLITRADDVDEVLRTHEVFEMPFGREMRAMTGGSDFVLGMPLGPDYAFQMECIREAFPVEEMTIRVAEISAAFAEEAMLRARPGFDPVETLLKRGPVRVCRDYYGLLIGDEDRYAEWALGVSHLLFADFPGTRAARVTGLAGAKRMNEVTRRSIERIEAGQGRADTPLARLVALHHSTNGKLSKDDIVAIILGMVSGFAPTNLLATGNILQVIFQMPEARRAVDAAVAADDDTALEKALVEALRFKPIRIGPHRYVTRDYTLRGKTLKKGSTVMAATFSAMFDPSRPGASGDPYRFDPERPSSDSLVFGHQIHWCVGAPLAKASMVPLFKALFSLKSVRPVKGKLGRMSRIGAYPEHLHVTFREEMVHGPQSQSMVTVCLPLETTADIAAINAALDAMGNPIAPELKASLDATSVLHVATVTVAGEMPEQRAAGDPYHLICEMSGDGSPLTVLRAFSDAVEPSLAPIVRSSCKNGADGGLYDVLKRGVIPVTPFSSGSFGLCFAGAPGHSVTRIRAERELEAVSRSLVEEAIAADTPDALGVLEHVRTRLKDKGFGWALRPVPSALTQGPGTNLDLLKAFGSPVQLGIGAVFIGVLGAAALLAPFIDVWDPVWATLMLLPLGLLAFVALVLSILVPLGLAARAYLKHLEATDQPDATWPDQAQFDTATGNEDYGTQNHLNAVSTIKAGLFRRTLLRLVFKVIEISAVYKFRPGTLSSIDTIHFARWVRVPGTQQLLFFSNFGGSWESYLEDFITKASAGLTGVWSNTLGFPRARDVFLEGATDAERFKRWARRQQLPTRFWYMAYPGHHTRDIRANSAIREGIATIDTEAQAAAWLCEFGALSRPSETLQQSEIQSIVFGPMGRLGEGVLLGLKLPDPMPLSDRARMLDYLLEHTRFGSAKPAGEALQVALGPTGWTALGVSSSAADDHGYGFSPAYRQGMDHAQRQRINGDTGPNAAELWDWGSGETRVDLLVLWYAETADAVAAREAEIETLAEQVGARITARQLLKASKFEPFGYRDGVSQPVVAGTPRAFAKHDRINEVKAGEFVFGYADERGNLPPSPSVLRNSDAAGVLPRLGDAELSHLADLGRNGSYLVVRQLRQNVEGFHDYCAHAAQDLAERQALPEATADFVGAKMVGRWKDGTPLLRAGPTAKDAPAENGFLYGQEDPQGMSVPLGSHIRRTNPRDSLDADRERALKLANRHRILRIGRTYKDGDEQGLMFMSLQADLERQFEFVQQTWVNAPGFHDLSDETDPLIGRRSEKGQFVIPHPTGGRVLRNMPDFVTMRGGGYFFLPGRRALRYLRVLAGD